MCAKRKTQAAAFADGKSHQLLPSLGADGIGGVLYQSLGSTANLEVLHTTDACFLISLQVGGYSFFRYHAVHPLPYHNRLGLGRRIHKNILYCLASYTLDA